MNYGQRLDSAQDEVLEEASMCNETWLDVALLVTREL
jgi:hypothetical protein